MNSSVGLPETWQACLTPAGTGAIATLALYGPRAWEIVRGQFLPHSRSGKGLSPAPQPGVLWLGQLGQDTKDQVVITLKGKHPYPFVEVHCHGGRQVIRMLVEAFEARGAFTCSWHELERRTGRNPVQSAAAVALTRARTVRTSGILLDQYAGAFAEAVDTLLRHWDREEVSEAARLLEGLAGHAAVGRHLTAPWRVVVAGAPNVGKSSLVNALAGYQRCVVAPTPGTTRDVVTTVIAVDGWPIELSDTAGLRATAGELEQQGIGLARAAAQSADLCLWLLDASAPPVWPDFRTESMRVVVNKVDLPATWDLDEVPDAIRVSALTSSGLDQLRQALSQWLVPALPPPGAAVPFMPNLCDGIEEAWRCYCLGNAQGAKLALENALQAIGRDDFV